MGQLDLGLITVHCPFCSHTETGANPDEAHDLMERHFDSRHALYIRSVTRA